MSSSNNNSAEKDQLICNKGEEVHRVLSNPFYTAVEKIDCISPYLSMVDDARTKDITPDNLHAVTSSIKVDLLFIIPTVQNEENPETRDKYMKKVYQVQKLIQVLS